MKKFVAIFGVILAMCLGVFVGCNNDKYADLKVSVDSVYDSKGNEIEYNEEEGCYIINYSDEIILSCKLTSSADIASKLQFLSDNDTALQIVSTSDTSVRIVGAVPSRNVKYRVKISSIESDNGSIDVYFKVALPTTGIELLSDLGFMYGDSIDLKENTSFFSEYLKNSSSPLSYEVDNKEVDYRLIKFISSNSEEFNLTKSDSDETIYSRQVSSEYVPSFRLINGVLSSLDSTLEGKVVVEAKSTSYDVDLAGMPSASLSQTDREELEKKQSNNAKLISTKEVSVVRELSLEDISISGGQVRFENFSTADKSVKLTADLYNNTTSSFSVSIGGENRTFYYNFETLSVSVDTSAPYLVTPKFYTLGSSQTVNLVSSSNALYYEQLSSSQLLSGRVDDFKFMSNFGTGTVYVDFEINLGFANNAKVSFAKLYQDYLNSLDEAELDALASYAKTSYIEFNVHALPQDVSVTVDGSAMGANLNIFDHYGDSNHGVLFALNIANLAQVKNDDRIVRVFLTEEGNAGNLVASNFIVSDLSGNLKILDAGDFNGASASYFDLDLSTERSFYIRANNVSSNEQKYVITFVNQLASSITILDGVEPQRIKLSDTVVGNTLSCGITALKGTETLSVKTIVDGEAVLLENNANNPFVVQYVGSGLSAEKGCLIGVYVDNNELVSDDISLEYDDAKLKVYDLDLTENLVVNSNYSAKANGQKLIKVLSIVGLDLGTYTLNLSTANRDSLVVTVKVVNQLNANSFAISVRDASNGSITLNKLNDSDPYLSQKVGGAFTLAYSMSPDMSAIKGTIMVTADNANIASINNATITANNTGYTTITITAKYYRFEKVDGYYVVKEGTLERHFTYEVYKPSTSKRLSRERLELISSDTLGFLHLDDSRANLSVSVVGEMPTITTDLTSSYYYSNLGGLLSYRLTNVSDSFYVDIEQDGLAYRLSAKSLPNDMLSKTIIMGVTIDEFGNKTELKCRITITKAVQTDDFTVTSADEDREVLVVRSDEKDGSHDYQMTIESSSAIMHIASNDVSYSNNKYQDGIVAYIVKEYAITNNHETGKLILSENYIDKTGEIASFEGGENGRIVTSLNGAIRLNLNTSNSTDYRFYVVLVASDRMSAEYDLSGNVYMSILVRIADGVNNSYLIETADDLKNIDPTKNYVLANDINLNSEEWTPIEDFTGVLNGYYGREFHTIYGLRITESAENIGLFANVGKTEDKYGAVINLSIVGAEISVSNVENVGIIAGVNEGIIMNCSVSGTVTLSNSSLEASVGGMVGLSKGAIYNFANRGASYNETDNFNFTTTISGSPTPTYSAYSSGDFNYLDSLSRYDLVSYNPVNVTMLISDSISHPVYAGGMAGKLEGGVINGLYGIFDRLDQKTSYSKFGNDGFDVVANINATNSGASIQNEDSKVGGVVGYALSDAKVFNVSVKGQIGYIDISTNSNATLSNNVGGVCGYVDGGVITNVLATARVRGESNVGGAVGYARSSVFGTLRVENYASEEFSDYAMIVGSDNVGGVFGLALASTVSIAYSHSYVSQTFSTIYKQYGDMYIYGGAGTFAGAVAGQMSTSASSNALFSTFTVVAKGGDNSATLSPIAKMIDSNILLDYTFYIGVLSGNNINKETYGNNYAYHILNYDQNEDKLCLDEEMELKNGAFTNVSYFGSSENYSVVYYKDDIETITFVPDYVYKRYDFTTYYSLISKIDTAMSVKGKTASSASITKIEDAYTYSYGSSVKPVIYSYISDDVEEESFMLVLLNSHNNTYRLSDLFDVTFTSRLGSSIKVTAGTSAVSVGQNNTITFNRVGVTTLTFSSDKGQEKTVVKLIIVDSFDNLIISGDSNAENVYNTKQIIAQKADNFNVFFSLLQDGEDVVSSLYSISHVVYYKESVSSTYDVVDEVNKDDYYSLSNGVFVFKKIGFYKVVSCVWYSADSKTFVITNEDEWFFEVKAVSTAIDILVDSAQYRVIEGDDDISLGVSLVTVPGSDDELPIEVNIEGGQDTYVYKINYDKTTSKTNVTVYYVNQDGNLQTKKDDKAVTGELDIFAERIALNSYRLTISVNNAYKSITDVRNYTVIFTDSPASEGVSKQISLAVTMQSLTSVSYVHYTYTPKVSKLVNALNTTPYDDNSDVTYAYSYAKDTEGKIVAGGEGMLVIDLVPYYANIKSVTIEAISVNSNVRLSLAQMVTIKSSDPLDQSLYFIYGDVAKTTSTGGLELNLTSSVSNATLVIAENSSSINCPSGKIEYNKFGEGDASNGLLYVKTTAPSSLTSSDKFVVTVTVKYLSAEVSVGDEMTITESLKEKSFTRGLAVENKVGLDMQFMHDGKERNYIAYTGTAIDGASSDYIDLIPTVANGYQIEYPFRAKVFTASGNEATNNKDKVNLSTKNDGSTRLTISNNADESIIGCYIEISVDVKKVYNGFTETTTFKYRVYVVDIVINSISINQIDRNDNLAINFSSLTHLNVIIDGYGKKERLTNAINTISMSIFKEGQDSSNRGISYFFKVKNPTTGNYDRLEATDNENSPFKVNMIAKDGTSSVDIASSDIGASSAYHYDVQKAIIQLEGTNRESSTSMMVDLGYVYKNGNIIFVSPDDYECEFTIQKIFNVVVTQGIAEEDLYPIESVSDLTNMKSGRNYILMHDLTLESHEPINVSFASFDGNNKVIYIKNFAYDTLSTGTSTYSKNFGLFGTISSSSIVKNVTVALYNNHANPMDLSAYSSVNFGAIAGINNGIITNCDVITILADGSSERLSAQDYLNGKNYNYTLNISTSSSCNLNLGLLVGSNSASGVITNSRVGREVVEYYRLSNTDGIQGSYSSANTYVKEIRTNVAPLTLVNVSAQPSSVASGLGSLSIAGFVSSNSGIISNSYAKNLQLESFNENGGVSVVKVAGFAVSNNGYIYGSYVAGFEETALGNNEKNNRKLGGGIYTNGVASGFVYENTQYIADCYSNIDITGDYTTAVRTSKIERDLNMSNNATLQNPAGAGFVYIMGTSAYIATSYSLSKVLPSSVAFSPFEMNLEYAPNPDALGKINRAGQIVDCFYLIEDSNGESFSPTSVDNERARQLSDSPLSEFEDKDAVEGTNQFIQESSFSNFSFSHSEYGADEYLTGVWAIYKDSRDTSSLGYPELVSANSVAISVREKHQKTTDGDVSSYYFTYIDGCAYGTASNPYLISNANDYNKVFGLTTQVSVDDDSMSTFTGNVRLIGNVNFSNVSNIATTKVELTSKDNTMSIFEGNYLTMSSISLSGSSSGVSSFGLFRDLNYVAVKNVNIGIDNISAGQSVAVGGLAGVIVNSIIQNVTVFGTTSSSRIIGKNYIGGLAGIILSADDANYPSEGFGLSGVKVNISLTGSVNNSLDNQQLITKSFSLYDSIKATSGRLRLNNLAGNSHYYAGGISGVIDLKQVILTNGKPSADSAVTTVNVSNVTVGEFVKNNPVTSSSNSDAIEFISDYVGGLFGFMGEQTYLSRAQLIVGQNTTLSSNKGAVGGLVGVNFGKISKSCVTFSDKDIAEIDANISKLATGQIDNYDRKNTTLFSRNPNASPIYIGGLVGVNIAGEIDGSGTISDSYSRVDVKNTSATSVGGIAGASSVGVISNVYTTSSLMGDLYSSDTKIGGIVGRILARNNLRGLSAQVFDENKTLLFKNVVALNVWDSNDYSELNSYNNRRDALNPQNYIGALYGYYDNVAGGSDTDPNGIVRVDGNVYAMTYVMQTYNIESLKDAMASRRAGNKSSDESAYPSILNTTIGGQTFTPGFRTWGPDNNLYKDAYLSEKIKDAYRIYPDAYGEYFMQD